MGGKGSNTTTTNQAQTYQPNPQAAGYITSALDRANQASNLPFNIPQAPVAGFSQDQQSAFNTINQSQGMAQPYIDQAANYFSPQGTQQFLNPYAANVMAGMQDVFGQQASQNTGQLTQAAGGVGADRIAVGQSELAKQQDLAAGQTLSGLYNNAAQQAQSAGYGTAALGSQAQNAALSGAQAQLASGGLQQQLQQAQLNAPYQLQLAQAAFPYQQSSFLSGQVGALAPGLGGTTTGQGQTTGPAPSLLSQILGLGTAGVGAAGAFGAFGGSPSYGGGSAGKGDAYGGSSANPLPGLSASDYGSGYARGGDVGYDDGGDVEGNPYQLPPGFNDRPINVDQQGIIPTAKIPSIQPHIPNLNLNPPASQNQSNSLGDVVSTGLELATLFAKRGGRIGYAGGGDILPRLPSVDSGGMSDVQPISPTPMLDTPDPGVIPMGAASGSGASGYGAKFPPGYYDKVPMDMRLSRKGVSHPGFRWEVYDKKTGTVMRKDLQTSSGASLARDRLDNKYGGYRYQTRPVRAQQLNDDEAKFLQDNDITWASGGRVGFADGGDAADYSFDDRFDAAFPNRHRADDVINPGDPHRLPDQASVQAWRDDVDRDMGAKAFPPPAGSHGRSKGAPLAADADTAPGPTAAMPYAMPARAVSSAAYAPPARSTPSAAQDVNPYSTGPAADPEPPASDSNGFAKSPWLALMSAGLGIAGGTSPFAAVNIGHGGLQGIKTLEEQRAASQKDDTIAQSAKRLAQEAKFHEDAMKNAARPYEELTKAQEEAAKYDERKLRMDMMKPVQVGLDDYGRPIMAKRNSETGEYEIIKTPTSTAPPTNPDAFPPSAPAGTGATPVPTPVNATGDSVLPKNATLTEGLQPGGVLPADANPTSFPPGVNPDALTGMSTADANKVRQIAEGRAKFLPLARNNTYNRYIMNKVSEYDPQADEGAFSRRSRTQNFFAVGTQGGGGQNIAAMNTFGQHADELFKLSKDLNLGQYTTWNEVKNALAARGFGSKEIQDKLGQWEVASKAVGDEGAKVFAGSNSALADREAWHTLFNASNPASVTQAKLKEVVRLIEGRLNSLTGQYNDGMRTTHAPAEFIKPRTQEVFDRIQGNVEIRPGGSTPAAAAAPAANDARARYNELRKQGMSKEDAAKAVGMQ